MEKELELDLNKDTEQKAGAGAGETSQNREAAIRLFGALSGVREEYLEACEKENGGAGKHVGRMTFTRRYGMAVAAVLCIALFGVSFYSLRVSRKGIDYTEDAAPQTRENDMAGGVGIRDSAAVVTDEEAPEEIADREVGLTEQRSGQKENGGIDGSNNISDSGIEDTQGTMDGATDGHPSEKLAQESSAQIDADRPDTAVEMTLADARKLAVIGAYIPVTWPGNGSIESVRGIDTAGQERVSITWTYDGAMDSFFLTVRNLGNEIPESVRSAMTDVSRPETFDARLYEIPYADTVPEEYREIFSDPVFAREDFTLECAEARIVSINGDSGDTDTPRGMFRVLYRAAEGDYVLLQFNGRGSAAEIWQMLMSVEAWK